MKMRGPGSTNTWKKYNKSLFRRSLKSSSNVLESQICIQIFGEAGPSSIITSRILVAKYQCRLTATATSLQKFHSPCPPSVCGEQLMDIEKLLATCRKQWWVNASKDNDCSKALYPHYCLSCASLQHEVCDQARSWRLFWKRLRAIVNEVHLVVDWDHFFESFKALLKSPRTKALGWMLYNCLIPVSARLSTLVKVSGCWGPSTHVLYVSITCFSASTYRPWFQLVSDRLFICMLI
jgi:hypothetical protein